MEISFGEMVLICLIAFVVLGPKELVRRAHQLGTWIAKLRTEMENFKVMAKEQMMVDEAAKVQDKLQAFADQHSVHPPAVAPALPSAGEATSVIAETTEKKNDPGAT
jgi:Sec-independent protein translocase protein TatA